MAKQYKYGIKFPITVSSDERTLFDLDYIAADKVKSDIMHLIFTPKGQRVRNPEFGTKLIQYIFNPNDNETWGDVVSEIKESVKACVPGCNITDVAVSETEDGASLIVMIQYTLSSADGSTQAYEIITKL